MFAFMDRKSKFLGDAEQNGFKVEFDKSRLIKGQEKVKPGEKLPDYSDPDLWDGVVKDVMPNRKKMSTWYFK